jgi:DNA sulfur modification protein DndE
MKFETSSETREFIESIYARAGARNQAVLGRAGLMLALGAGVPKEFKPKGSSGGLTLNDEQVLSDEIRDLVKTALNHRSGRSLDEVSYRQEFRRHFEYGCQQLKQLWDDCGNDQTRFVTALLKLSNTGAFAQLSDSSGSPVHVRSLVETEIKLKLLHDAPEWSLNGPGTSNGLLVISGKPGRGKSQLSLDLLAQLARQGARFVFFDLKGELEDDPNNAQQRENRRKFLELTGARYTRLIQESLPINPLYRPENPNQVAQVSYEIASLIKCFAKQLGAKQERNISDAYQHLMNPDFLSLEQELLNMGADGVDRAVIQKIARRNIFATASRAITPEEWLSTSLVIDFKDLGNDDETKALVAVLVLNFLMKRMSQNLGVKNGIQPIRMVLFVDEAHLLLPKESKAGLLGSLARQGRSWGFPVWLASQDADKFITKGDKETNFADLAECGIHFTPNTLTDSQQRDVIGSLIHRELQKGEAVLRLKGRTTTGRVRQFWKDSGK